MSVILYDARNGAMWADSRAYAGDSHPIGNKMKIHRIDAGPLTGSLLGITSCQPGVGEEFKQWVIEGMNKDAYAPTSPSLDALLVKPNGEVYLFSDAYYPSGPLAGDVFTIGSGKKYALGAFRAGADAETAIAVACACDSMCGAPITRLALSEAAPEPPVAEEKPTVDVSEAINWLSDVEAS